MKGTMPPQPKIETPTPFAEWSKTQALFDDGVTETRTHVVNGKGGTRLAYGASPEGFWFFIEMKAHDEVEFWRAYLAWRASNEAGEHTHASDARGKKPPTCGTPNTPPC